MMGRSKPEEKPEPKHETKPDAKHEGPAEKAKHEALAPAKLPEGHQLKELFNKHIDAVAAKVASVSDKDTLKAANVQGVLNDVAAALKVLRDILNKLPLGGA